MRQRPSPFPCSPWLLSIVALLACNTTKLDQDGDGFTELTGDCDDLDANVHPDAREVCYNGIDDNCNGIEDEEDATSGRVWYADLDGDNYGDEGITIEACEQPENYAPNKWDCNESDASINPDAVEVCDAVDNDCDGQVDEASAEDAQIWYPDRDGDGYGDDANERRACEAPAGYTSVGGDCGDLDPLQSPDATEDCRTEADDDCDGEANEEDAYACVDYYADLDGDGFAGTAACLCGPTALYAATEPTDCDDERSDVYPGAPITSRFASEDCNGAVSFDLDDFDHSVELTHAAFPYAVKIFDATGDGIDDLLVGAQYYAPVLLEGPVTDHTDVSNTIASLPQDPGSVGNYWLTLLPDQDGDGLEDVLQRYQGDESAASGLYVYSSADRGALSTDNALWTLEEAWPANLVRLMTSADGASAELLVSQDPTAIDIYTLQSDGSAPTLLGTVDDPMGLGNALYPTLRADLDGDGVPELVVSQATGYGWATDLHDTPSSNTFVPAHAMAILEQYPGSEDPMDLEVRHIIYGWSRLGASGGAVAQDLDGDGLLDLLATEVSYMLESNSGAVMAFYADSIAQRDRFFSYVSDADAVYSGDAQQDLNSIVAQADLDGDGDAAMIVSGPGTLNDHMWLMDRFPAGHHRMNEVARQVPRAQAYRHQGDANSDGIDDLVLQTGRGTGVEPYVLQFYWGERL